MKFTKYNVGIPKRNSEQIPKTGKNLRKKTRQKISMRFLWIFIRPLREASRYKHFMRAIIKLRIKSYKDIDLQLHSIFPIFKILHNFAICFFFFGWWLTFLNLNDNHFSFLRSFI